MSFLSQQIAKGLQQINSFAGEPVTYGTGVATINITKAVPRRIIPTDTANYDQHTIANGRIWDFFTTDLVVASVEVEPTIGHTVTEATGEVWEVVDNPLTSRCWDYVDTGRTVKKVFTLRKAV